MLEIKIGWNRKQITCAIFEILYYIVVLDFWTGCIGADPGNNNLMKHHETGNEWKLCVPIKVIKVDWIKK